MDQTFIEVTGARENNLKNISLRLPRNKITVFTGVSGSGKSSIVFDTIAQEAGRQLNETYSSFTRLFLPRYKHPEVDEAGGAAQDRTELPDSRPATGHTFRRGVSALAFRTGTAPQGYHLHPRRTDHRPPPVRHRQSAAHHRRTSHTGKHGGGHRAQPGCHPPG